MIADYQPLDHTGDIGWKISAPSFPELLEKASLALSDTLVEIATVDTTAEFHWELSAKTREGLLVKQLEEILFWFDAKGVVFREYSVNVTEERLKCSARGERLNRSKHQFKTEIKAVTYHHLKIQALPDGAVGATVILDV